MKRLLTPDSVRSLIFGVEDSLVSTVGLISGIAVTGAMRSSVLLTGFILITVEAFSMAVGVFLSDNTAEEFRTQSTVSFSKSFGPASIMFVSYFVAGIVILLPYIFAPDRYVFGMSILISLITLFVLGFLSASVSHVPKIKRGIIMMTIGGFAIVVGIIVGTLANIFLNI